METFSRSERLTGRVRDPAAHDLAIRKFHRVANALGVAADTGDRDAISAGVDALKSARTNHRAGLVLKIRMSSHTGTTITAPAITYSAISRTASQPMSHRRLKRRLIQANTS